MKKIILLAICMAVVSMVYAQDPSAALQVDATDKGFLPPRITTAQRDDITNPATGLLIFNTTVSSTEVNVGTPSVPVWQTATLPEGTSGQTLHYDGTNWVANSTLFNSGSSVGVGTTAPNTTAILDITSTTQGFLPPRMTSLQRDGISSPAEGLVIYNTDVKCLDTYNGVRWIACNTIGATDVYNPATGQIWMDRNLGASQVATSSTDADSYGDLYQWGRAADGHEKRNSDTYGAVFSTNGVANFNTSGNAWDGRFILRNSLPNNWVDPFVAGVDNLWQGVNGINNPCPSGYRVPTDAEWEAERQSWGSNNNAVGAFASPLKLPLAGYRDRTTGALFPDGSVGGYWSSTISSATARSFSFVSSNANISNNPRANGYSVRCIKD